MSKDFCLFSFVIYLLDVCVQEPQLVHGDQDDFWELVLFFLSVGSGLRTLIVRLGSKHLALLSQFTGPQKFANLSQTLCTGYA